MLLASHYYLEIIEQQYVKDKSHYQIERVRSFYLWLIDDRNWRLQIRGDFHQSVNSLVVSALCLFSFVRRSFCDVRTTPQDRQASLAHAGVTRWWTLSSHVDDSEVKPWGSSLYQWRIGRKSNRLQNQCKLLMFGIQDIGLQKISFAQNL